MKPVARISYQATAVCNEKGKLRFTMTASIKSYNNNENHIKMKKHTA
jgi:hypothetical protein